MKALTALALVALVALAGCSSPAAPDPGSGSTDDDGTDLPAPTTPTDSHPRATPPADDPSGNGTTDGGLDDGSQANATLNATPVQRTWASLTTAAIRPGVYTITEGSGCTSNFLFTSPDNRSVYIGYAAHCANECPDVASGLCPANGCDPQNFPLELGSKVEVRGLDGEDYEGELAYTSWGVMKGLRVTDNDLCRGNDMALVKLSAAAAARANPAVQHFGGPIGLADAESVQAYDKLLSFQNSGLRQGISALSPKEGYVLSPPDGYSMEVYTVTNGVPGDSGSGFMTADGSAIGVLSTVSLAGGTNGVAVLPAMLEYAQEKGNFTARLATWELIDNGLLP